MIPRVISAVVWAMASALTLSAGEARAGLPLLSEDAGVLAAGQCEFESVVASTRAGGPSGRELGLGLGCGAGRDLQWNLGWSRAQAGGATARGLSLGGKLGLWKGADDAALVLAPTLAWADDGGGWRHVSQDFNLAYSGPAFESTTLHLNLGHGRDLASRQRSTGWSVALEHAGVDLGGLKLAAMGDLAGDDHGAPWWNLGLRATLVPEVAWLSLSYARQVEPARARLASLSLKLAF